VPNRVGQPQVFADVLRALLPTCERVTIMAEGPPVGAGGVRSITFPKPCAAALEDHEH